MGQKSTCLQKAPLKVQPVRIDHVKYPFLKQTVAPEYSPIAAICCFHEQVSSFSGTASLLDCEVGAPGER